MTAVLDGMAGEVAMEAYADSQAIAAETEADHQLHSELGGKPFT